jgi:hypothetical protein
MLYNDFTVKRTGEKQMYKNTIVENPIPKTGIWVTHETIEDLMSAVQASSGDPHEVTLMMHGMMMALNTAHHIVETEILNKHIFE